jgi:hypothetical protein
MTVKSQLHACAEALMVGVRATERAVVPDPRVLAILRACLDVVERLRRSAEEVTADQVTIALNVVRQAEADLSRSQAPVRVVLKAVGNARERLEQLHTELDG